MGWKDHRLIEDGEERFCAHCSENWPCPTAALVAEVQAELKEPEGANIRRLTWTRNTGPGKNSWEGSIDGRVLFTITWASVRRGNEEPWELRTRLPWGIPDQTSRARDEDRLKARAEIILTAFVHKIGARWPGPGEGKDS